MSTVKILCIDDESNILSALKRSLRSERIELTVTNTPEEFFHHLRNEQYAVVISDQKMPTLQGTDLLEMVKELSPDTMRILLTGYADINAAVDAINRGAVYRFLTKPWEDGVLRRTIEQAVYQYHLIEENKRLNQLTLQQNVALQQLNESLEQRVEERTTEVMMLNGKLKHSFISAVKVMASMSEMHSSSLGNHGKRVSRLARQLGNLFGLDEELLIQLELAALLHDIGEIGVNPAITKKSENLLTNQERDQLKVHTTHGEALVKMVSSLEDAAAMVRSHHEHVDGTRYPDMLRGEQIPLGARIIAVADAYDTYLNNLSNFRLVTPMQAFEYVQRFSGQKYDIDVVMVLKQLIQSELGIQDSDEVEILSKDLQAGMILSRDLITVKGVLMLPRDTTLEEQRLVQLKNFLLLDPPASGIFVYRASIFQH